MKSIKVFIGGIGFGLVAASAPAKADCAVPNVISNGQVADATEVMDNFDAVAQCAEDAADNSVTQSGTPQPGEIAVFSADRVVTSGDLTGDVTTSGGTETTLADTGVSAGSYINPNITIDSKGRVTAAASSTVGGSGSGVLSARIRLDGTQSVSANTSTVIQFDTLEFEAAPGMWAGAPGFTLVIPNGINRAEVVASTGGTSTDQNSYWQMVIQNNGANVAQDALQDPYYGRGVVTSGVFQVSSGDQVRFVVRSGASQTLGSTGIKPFMSIKMWNE